MFSGTNIQDITCARLSDKSYSLEMYPHLPKPFEKLDLYELLPLFDWLRGKVTADFGHLFSLEYRFKQICVTICL